MESPTTLATSDGQSAQGLLEGDWPERLAYIAEMMRDMSVQTNAQEMVRSYGSRVRKLMPGGAMAFGKPAGARASSLSDHPVEHVDRADRSLEPEGAPAAPGRGVAGGLDLRRRAAADRGHRAFLGR